MRDLHVCSVLSNTVFDTQIVYSDRCVELQSAIMSRIRLGKCWIQWEEMRAVYRQEMNKINVALDSLSSHSTQDDFAGHLLAAGCPPLGISTGVEPVMKLCARIAGSARRESFHLHSD